METFDKEYFQKLAGGIMLDVCITATSVPWK